MTTSSTQAAGEREAFEAWCTENECAHLLKRAKSGGYVSDYIEDMWVGWMARAALYTAPTTGSAPDARRDGLAAIIRYHTGATAIDGYKAAQAVIDALSAAPTPSASSVPVAILFPMKVDGKCNICDNEFSFSLDLPKDAAPPANPVASAEPTEAMLNAARDWSIAKYGQGIGNDAAIGCWKAMIGASMGGDARPVATKYEYAQPGSPEFDGAEAYQAHLEALYPDDARPVAIYQIQRDSVTYEDVSREQYERAFPDARRIVYAARDAAHKENDGSSK